VSEKPAGGPGPWRLARAILPLPFTATVIVPLILVLAGGANPGLGLDGALAAIPVLAGCALAAAGLALIARTIALFARVGEGTLAPWDPPRRLVVSGPYCHVRHPMITGVATVIAGEALALGSAPIAIWWAAFVAVNSVYLPLVEEPILVRRFGDEYERYQRHVPRLVPRRRPWEPR
jgi:protein-S-isoprenylcysteine O-methyltransferase Ste14